MMRWVECCFFCLVQCQTGDLNNVNRQVQELLAKADSANCRLIEEHFHKPLNLAWEALDGELKRRHSDFEQLSTKWDELEQQICNWEKALERVADRLRHVDPVVRSRRHLQETKHVIQVSISISSSSSINLPTEPNLFYYFTSPCCAWEHQLEFEVHPKWTYFSCISKDIQRQFV